MVTGTVAYLQRSALPPNAIVHVQLQDVSAQDKPARIVAEAKIPTEGKQVPIAFRIPYAATDIDPAHRYVVRATIGVGGKMIFTSTTAYPVITRGASTEVAIMVHPVSAHPAPGSRHRPAKLEGREWSLVELGGSRRMRRRTGKLPICCSMRTIEDCPDRAGAIGWLEVTNCADNLCTSRQPG